MYSGGEDGSICAWWANNYTLFMCSQRIDVEIYSLAVTYWGGVYAGGAGRGITYCQAPQPTPVSRN